MPEALPTGYVLFCDDVRQEVNNKASLIGVYGSDIILYQPTLPVTLPKLGVLIHFVQAIDDLRDYSIEVFMPWDDPEKPIARTDVRASEIKPTGKTSAGKDATKIAARMHLVMSPLPIKETGTIKVIVTRTSEEPIELGKLEIIHSPKRPKDAETEKAKAD